MDKLLRHLAGFHALTADDLHVLVGVFHLDVHQLIQKAGEAGTVGAIQQETEHVEVVIDVVQQIPLMPCGVLAHFRLLCLVIQLMKTLLDLPEHSPELVHHRLHDGAEQTLLVSESGVDGPCAGARLLGDGAQGCIHKSSGQEFFFGTFQHPVIDAGLLLCHILTAPRKYSKQCFITMF